MPAGASCLATSPACAVQAMKWETRAVSAQFHLEIETDTVENWAAIPEYKAALEKAMGPDGVSLMKEAVDQNLAEFQKAAERFYINWLQMTAQT